MLSSLHIENVAVIKSCEIAFSPGFTTLTGETGAGKSMILDSIGLLCGARADKSVIRTGESQALVSGFFSGLTDGAVSALDSAGFSATDGEAVLQRTVTADGRSVCRVNGRQVPLSVFREIAETLVNIHGQQDNWQLLREDCHLALLDRYASDEAELDSYRAAYRDYLDKKNSLTKIREQAKKDGEERDILEFRLSELSAAKLKRGEEETLLAKRKLLQNAERLEKQTGFAYRALKGGDKVNAVYLIERSAAALSGLTGVSEEYGALSGRLESVRCEIEDIADTAIHLAGSMDGDPTEQLTRLETRLDRIERLKKKYRRGHDELVDLLEETKIRLQRAEHAEDAEEEAAKELQKAEDTARKQAKKLTEKRLEAAQSLSERICEELAFLDMPRVSFTVEVKEQPGAGGEASLTADGADAVLFLLSTAAGEPPKPLSKIASGGELSRVMLAIKSVFTEADGVGTVIFDEIDAGVSGKTARKIGIKLKKLSEGSQVFCVTHSAQIASLASCHLKVEKRLVCDRFESGVRQLSREERVEELARILGGISVTDSQRRAAEDLLTEDGIKPAQYD